MNEKCLILMVEDSDEDFYTTHRTLARFRDCDVTRCKQGSEVLPILSRTHDSTTLPQLILLDLNLPGRVDGRTVLAELKAHTKLKKIPVVILTTSANPKDVEHCYFNGAAGYLVKPVDLDRFTELIGSMANYWFDAVTLPVSARL